MPGFIVTVGAPMLLPCGAPDCKSDHETFDLKRVIMLGGGVDIEEAESMEGLAPALEHGTVVKGEKVFLTMLGVWWEESCMNAN